MLKQAAMMYLPIQTQQEIGTPTPITLQNAQGSVQQNIKPGVPGMPQYAGIPGSYSEAALAPNTPIMGENNTPSYIGAAGKATPQNSLISAAQGGPSQGGPVAAGMPVGSEENIKNNVGEMSRHYASLQDQSSGNALTQSLRGDIKTLAKKAITGTESDKMAYYNGLLAVLGKDSVKDRKEATDLLHKSLNQLNLLTPATSDAGRELVTLARPNGQMSEAAIEKAVDKLASQVESNMAIRNYLTQFKQANGGQGNSAAYQTAREKVEKVADPKIWEYLSLKPGSKEAAAFARELSPTEKKSMASKMDALEAMGVIGQ